LWDSADNLASIVLLAGDGPLALQATDFSLQLAQRLHAVRISVVKPGLGRAMVF
jgi:hypothetical protein